MLFFICRCDYLPPVFVLQNTQFRPSEFRVYYAYYVLQRREKDRKTTQKTLKLP